jgi:DMSO/TMAO reductase YedYZ heme-binding membrane subunit
MNLINQKLNILIKKLNKNKYWKILIDIIINWNIPFFSLIKKYLVYISILWLIIFINPTLWKNFWEYSYDLLIIILLTSPISKIFPKFKILNKILILRRPIWIIIWSFLIAHLVWFLLVNNINIIDFLSKEILNYKSFLFWWIWGFIFMLFPLITSNNLSQKILKNKWKIFQKMTHWFFVFSVLHIYIRSWEFEDLIPLILWVILKIIVFKKVVILK